MCLELRPLAGTDHEVVWPLWTRPKVVLWLVYWELPVAVKVGINVLVMVWRRWWEHRWELRERKTRLWLWLHVHGKLAVAIAVGWEEWRICEYRWLSLWWWLLERDWGRLEVSSEVVAVSAVAIIIRKS